MEKVRCPHCGEYVDPPGGGGPFFCSQCHQVIDFQARRAGVAAAPPETEPPDPAPHGVDRLGPGHGLAAGQTAAIGYLLAAAVAGGASYGLGRLAGSHVYLPVLWAGIAGWVTQRALAIGSGGGTPDRTVLGSIFLLLVGVAATGVFAWVDYDEARRRETKHWAVVFGDRGTESAVHFAKRLRDRRGSDRGDRVKLLEDDTFVSVSEEETRARNAVATGKTSLDPFDVHLLASTGRRGFEGFLLHRAKEGRTVRITPTHEGWPLGGSATLALAAVELLTFWLLVFQRRD
jgi:endogenous inhibitor of DNA gyrase (YacG/DUF329 family)